MRAVSVVRLVAIAGAALPAVIAATGLAHADPPPPPGDLCSVSQATTQDSSGRTMWCNHMMTGDHTLVWQYDDPSDQQG